MLATCTWRKAEEADLIASLILASWAGRTVFALHGDLGAGKTTLIKGFCRALGVTDQTSSPTFSIVNEYHGASGTVYHFDLYRLKSPRELADIGFEEYIDSGSPCFIEWPELASDLLPEDAVHIRLEVSASGVRILRLSER